MKDTKKALFALVAVAITIGYLWQTHRVVTPKAATWNDVLTEARQGGYRIISTDELWGRYKKDPDKMLLVDTRQEWEYRTGHIKAALTDGLMGAMLQSPVVLSAVAAILIFFATSLLGFWELRLPYWLTQAAARSYAGYFGSLFMGITLGVVAAPCIGPFVLGLLTWVGSTAAGPHFGPLIG